MKIELDTARICLGKHHALSLTKARGCVIRCRQGNLWITQDFDLRDIELAPGESFTLDRDGPAVVSALTPSFVELLPAQRAGEFEPAARRWLKQLQAAVPTLPSRRRRAELLL